MLLLLGIFFGILIILDTSIYLPFMLVSESPPTNRALAAGPSPVVASVT